MRAIKQPRALATRESILTETAQLFALKGYHDTKLEEILQATGVTTGAFFHHFRSKEDLAFAVLDRHMEKRRDQLEHLEKGMPNPTDDDALEPVFRRLDAIQEMAGRRAHRKGGCIIGNLSTALCATHNAFRRRLADCLDAMALEFKPHLDAAAKLHCPKRQVDTWDLARYIVTVIEGSILLARTHQDRRLLGRHFDHLKQYIKQTLRA